MWSTTRALEVHAEYFAQLARQVKRTSASLAREYQAISRSSQQKAEAMRKLTVGDPSERASKTSAKMRRDQLTHARK